jgi:hypothetical protein
MFFSAFEHNDQVVAFLSLFQGVIDQFEGGRYLNLSEFSRRNDDLLDPGLIGRLKGPDVRMMLGLTFHSFPFISFH